MSPSRTPFFSCTYFFQGSATLARKEGISCAIDAQWPCEEEGKGKDSSPSFTPELPPPLLFPTPPTEATLVVLPIMTCAGRFCRKGCLLGRLKKGGTPRVEVYNMGREIFHQGIFK